MSILGPAIPTIASWFIAKAIVLKKLEDESSDMKKSLLKVTDQIDKARQDIYRLQISGDRVNSSINELKIQVKDASISLQEAREDIISIKVREEDLKDLKQAYGKVLLILDKIVQKQKTKN